MTATAPEAPVAPPLAPSTPNQPTRRPGGLSAAEAADRLRQYGPNAVDAAPPAPWWRVLVRQFKGLIVFVLGAAALVSWLFDDRVEAYAILAVIGINGGIGFWLEWSAQASMTALRKLGLSTARVLRDGQVQAVPSDQLTLGDVLLIEAGEVVAADAELFEAQQLQVNESALTGESMPATKTLAAPDAPAADVPLAEQTNRLFKGTAVVNGTAKAYVTGVGGGTQLGEIARLVASAGHAATPLEDKLARLARQLVIFTVVLAAVYIGAGLWRGQPIYKLLEMAIVLAVAAIPEGMSIVATLALAYGMLRLARHQVLVKRLAAVETLGGTDVIFTDKTGTLTQNQMAVHTVWLPEEKLEFSTEQAGDEVTEKANADGKPATAEAPAAPETAAPVAAKTTAVPLKSPLLAVIKTVTAPAENPTSSTENPIPNPQDPGLRAKAHATSLSTNNQKPTTETYQLLLRTAVLCNNATFAPADAAAALGDPLEVALLALAHAHGFDVPAAQAAERLAELPFNSDTRLMATQHRLPASAGPAGQPGQPEQPEQPAQTCISVKGAAEAVLPLCTQLHAAEGPQQLPQNEQAEWLQRAEALAQTGLRTLALAYRPAPPDAPAEASADLARDLVLLGLVAFLDPARPEVIPAIEACGQAGIRVLMVTGDHPATALTVARQVHLAPAAAGVASAAPSGAGGADGDANNPDNAADTDNPDATVVTGPELAALLAHPDAAQHLRSVRVFARVSPAQKLDLIDFYQRQGHVVAMIGDGVNDAPALKKADIGVAMGQRGTQVAAEAAALVLRDDSFASVVVAVEQGRIIFTNIRRFVLYLVSCNLSELLVVMTAGLIGSGAVLLPLQILFLNLVTDVFPALALSVGRGSPRVMAHRPHDPQGPLMRPGDWRLAAAYAALMTAALLGSYYLARHGAGFAPEMAGTVLFYGLALAQMVHVFNMAGVSTPLRDNDVLRNRYVWLALALCTALLLLTYFLPPLRGLLGLHQLSAHSLWYVLVPAGAVLVLGQALGWAVGRRWPQAAGDEDASLNEE